MTLSLERMEREERTCEFDEGYFYGPIKIATAMTLALNYEPRRMTEFNDHFQALRSEIEWLRDYLLMGPSKMFT